MDDLTRGRADPLDPGELRRRVDEVLLVELGRAREEIAAADPAAGCLVEELERLVGAGGKRVRPVLCVLGHVAAGGRVEDALRAAAALELFHTFALVHDDVMDESEERRGVASTPLRFAKAEPGGEAFGRSVAILVGDLAFALAVDLLLGSPLPAPRVLAAARRLRTMSLATAAGQYLDVRGEGPLERLASLKTGAYTAEAPLAIGAELAGGGAGVLAALERFGRPLGVAFQLLDDVADGSADGAAAADACRLLDEAAAALEGAPIDAGAAAALRGVVALVRGRS